MEEKSQHASWQSSISLYDSMASDYDGTFDQPGHRMAWDQLAGEMVQALLPSEAGLIIDAGCGTGRWSARWAAEGHQVVGIEHSPEMIRVLRKRIAGTNFRLIESDMSNAAIAAESADLVVAMGSLQYTQNPSATMKRLVEWAKPGKPVCVVVDSLLGLVIDLIREGKTEEALERSRTRHGVLTHSGEKADLHLYDRASLEADMQAAGLGDIVCRGVLVSVSALGRKRCAQLMTEDPDGYLNRERELSGNTALADGGLHIVAWGRKPW